MVTPKQARLAIIGMGRMGREIDTLAAEHGFTVTARLGRDELGAVGSGGPSDAPSDARASALEALRDADVAIEVTSPDAAPGNIALCLEAGCPVVVGTTGWHERLDDVRAQVESVQGALLWAPNFSLGAAIMKALCTRAGELLKDLDDFDVHLSETHHVHKKDAPSGTALMLGAALGEAAGRTVETTSVRVGHVPGRHEVWIDGPHEYLTLTHEARSRRVFADGALRAASWLRGKSGVFTMDDVVDAL